MEQQLLAQVLGQLSIALAHTHLLLPLLPPFLDLEAGLAGLAPLDLVATDDPLLALLLSMLQLSPIHLNGLYCRVLLAHILCDRPVSRLLLLCGRSREGSSHSRL